MENRNVDHEIIVDAALEKNIHLTIHFSPFSASYSHKQFVKQAFRRNNRVNQDITMKWLQVHAI